MIEFPDAYLKVCGGTISGFVRQAHDWVASEDFHSVEFLLAPFSLPRVGIDPPVLQTVKTSVRMEQVRLGVLRASQLSGRRIPFVVGPVDGAIDASIYVNDCHNPIDVGSLVFGVLGHGEIECTAVGRILFEYEDSGFRDREFVITGCLSLVP
jgi:hypothetical protein